MIKENSTETKTIVISKEAGDKLQALKEDKRQQGMRMSMGGIVEVLINEAYNGNKT